MPTFAKWRKVKPCVDCPFNKDGPGRHLRDSLGPGRWRSILASLRRHEHFVCHKTSAETGNGTDLLCAGAIAYQEKHHCISNFQQIMERLHVVRSRPKKNLTSNSESR